MAYKNIHIYKIAFSFSIYSLIDMQVVSISIVGNAAINMIVQISLQYPGFHGLLIYEPRSRISGSYSSILNFLRNLHMVSIVLNQFTFPPIVP